MFRIAFLSLGGVCLFAVDFVNSSNIPEFIHICHRNDPEVAACVRNSVEALKPRLAKGIPELNVPGIDPFYLKKIVIFDGAQNPNLDIYLDDVVVSGLGNFQIKKLKLDVEKKTYRVGIRMPFLSMEGGYYVNAKLLNAPIKTEGKFHGNATNVDGQVLIQGIVNKHHLKFESMAMKIRIGDFNMDIGDGLANDPVLGQAARQLISGNKQDIIRLAVPHIERKCSEIAIEMANKITENLDYDEVFPA